MGDFSYFFLAKESRRRRIFFQDLVLDLKEKTIENRVSDVKNLEIFACGADDYPTITNTKSQNPVYQSSPLALTVITTRFKVSSELTSLKC